MPAHRSFQTTRGFAALATTSALCGALLLSGCGRNAVNAGRSNAVAGPRSPVTTPIGVRLTSPATSIDGLPGTLFYGDEENGRLVRIDHGQTRKVPSGYVSPDGRSIAYLNVHEDTGMGDLIVIDVDGGHSRKLRTHVSPNGVEPVWSPDGTKVLLGIGPDDATPEARLFSVSDGTEVALPKGISHFIHYRWSGDGKRLLFAGDGHIKYANPDGSNLRTVPILGDFKTRTNPTMMRSDDVISVNTDGSRAVVDVHVGDEPDGDIAPSEYANTVIDTATGRPIHPPVRGKILALLYGPTGDLLVRTEYQGQRSLTLLSPDDKVLAHVTEPASLKTLYPQAYRA